MGAMQKLLLEEGNLHGFESPKSGAWPKRMSHINTYKPSYQRQTPYNKFSIAARMSSGLSLGAKRFTT